MDKCKSALSQLFQSDSFPQDAFFIDKEFHGKKIIIYGAGESFHYYKEIAIRGYGYVPSIVLDQKFQPGDTFLGIPAYPPQAYRPSEDEKKNAIVVVCLGKQSYFEQVIDTLRDMGFINIISLMDIYEIHNPFRLSVELDQKGFQYYLDRQSRIETCFDLFTDRESREIFIGYIETHMKRKPVALPMRPRHEQYVPKDIRLSHGYSRFIYCGVSVGEMAGILSQTGKIEELVCFEPDRNQYRLTAEYISAHRESLAKRITALPCAVYSHEASKPFTWSDTSFGSRVLEIPNETAETNISFVQCVSIDNILYGFYPTFINMDIEGAELDALKGAENTIQASTPDLGICVYHSPCHIWEIPLYLHSLKLGYQFFLRNYTSFTGETVLYATT